MFDVHIRCCNKENFGWRPNNFYSGSANWPSLTTQEIETAVWQRFALPLGALPVFQLIYNRVGGQDYVIVVYNNCVHLWFPQANAWVRRTLWKSTSYVTAVDEHAGMLMLATVRRVGRTTRRSECVYILNWYTQRPIINTRSYEHEMTALRLLDNGLVFLVRDGVKSMRFY